MLTELHTCLFFEARGWRDFGNVPQGRHREYMCSLIEGIREEVKAITPSAEIVGVCFLSNLFAFLQDHLFVRKKKRARRSSSTTNSRGAMMVGGIKSKNRSAYKISERTRTGYDNHPRPLAIQLMLHNSQKATPCLRYRRRVDAQRQAAQIDWHN